MSEENISRDAYLTLERSTIGCPLGVVVSTSMVGLTIYGLRHHLGHIEYVTCVTRYLNGGRRTKNQLHVLKPLPQFTTPSTYSSHFLFIRATSNSDTMILDQFLIGFTNDPMLRQAP